jgi:hypothetical protein
MIRSRSKVLRPNRNSQFIKEEGPADALSRKLNFTQIDQNIPIATTILKLDTMDRKVNDVKSAQTLKK